jgi:hypothetical protein
MSGTQNVSSSQRSDRRMGLAWRLLAVLGAALVTMLNVSAPARAGTWALVSCSLPNGKPAATDGWLAGGAGEDRGALNTCSAAGGSLIAQVGDQSEQPAYQPATWTFTAPQGSTIAGGMLMIGFFTPEGQAYAETPANSYDSANVIANCQYNTGSCGSTWNSETVPIRSTQGGGTQIFVGAECVSPVEGHDYCQEPGDPWIGADGVDAQTNLYRALIDLSNSTTPTASAFGGGLLEPAASGVQDLLFTAQDPQGPGILNVTVTIDGKAVYDATPDPNAGQCQSIGTDSTGAGEFLSEQPCKQDLEVDVPVDTRLLASGSHLLKVRLTDAAGNTATVFSNTISTSRVPHFPNGMPCVIPTLSLTANGKTAPAPIRWARRVRVRGRLHCGETPIPHAEIQLTGERGRMSVTTNPRGSFAFTLAPGPSRTLRFAYRAYSDDAKPAVTATLRIRVFPAITLNISPRSTRNDGTITWRGLVAGGPYPAAGLTLLVEVKAGSRWEAFDQLVTHTGRFTYRYTFLRTTRPTTYSFRIAMPASGAAGYRYQPASSDAITVHVAP